MKKQDLACRANGIAAAMEQHLGIDLVQHPEPGGLDPVLQPAHHFFHRHGTGD
jgi:hypothetical protein